MSVAECDGWVSSVYNFLRLVIRTNKPMSKFVTLAIAGRSPLSLNTEFKLNALLSGRMRRHKQKKPENRSVNRNDRSG